MIHTKRFKELSKSDVSIAGGKGASLGEMINAGIPVPDGFVILTDAFDRFIESNNLNAEIQSALDKVDIKRVNTVDDASETISAIIADCEISAEISTEILSNFKKLKTKFVAVRSSATSEDGSAAAWAGQLESFLNTTEKDLLGNVKKCWASLFTPRAIFYRIEKQLHKDKVSVAVVVQKMIDSEESGIAFSVHPVTEDHDQIIIEAGLGLGEAVVSGSITPDSYVVSKRTLSIIEKQVNTQNKALYRVEYGGNKWKDLSTADAKKQVLTDKAIKQLAQLIIKIENHYGFPVDVEWARENNNFHIVQSRPITTLKSKSVQERSSDYIKLFEMADMPFLITTISMEHYKPLNALATYSGRLWTTYLPKETQKRTLKEGEKLFGNKEHFEKYLNDFDNYKKRSLKLFEKISSQDLISRNELSDFFNAIAELWLYYKKTESFYVDAAYIYSKRNKTAANNLKCLAQIKNSGREHMNKMIFLT